MRAKLTLFTILAFGVTCLASQHVFSIKDTKLYLNYQEFKMIGLRCSNALISDASTQDLIDHLDLYKTYGVNTVTVYMMGSRFGDVKGYRPDASLDPVYANRMARIIEAADQRGMVRTGGLPLLEHFKSQRGPVTLDPVRGKPGRGQYSKLAGREKLPERAGGSG